MLDGYTRRELVVKGVGFGVGVGTVSLTSAASERPLSERTVIRVTDSVADAETCRLPRTLASELGVVTGQQVRLSSPSGPAVFTVTTTGSDAAVNVAGRDRLGASGTTFDADVDTRVVSPTLDEATAAETGGFVERLDDADSDALVALAPHGGYIEHTTDDQARRVGERLAVPAWYCAGWWPGGGAFDRWHVGSTKLHSASFPRLAEVLDRGFDSAVSFHGWTESHVGIGGGAPLAQREAVRDSVAAAVGGAFDVRLVADDEWRDGEHPDNVVNRSTTGEYGGVQVEQPWDARGEYGLDIADAVSDAFG